MIRFVICCLFMLFFLLLHRHKNTTGLLRYLPLGDSYTICTGASEKEAWPYLLTGHLQEQGISCVLLDNPARNGYSTRDLIVYELPLVKTLKPDFVTLLIGVNDWVRQIPAAEFESNLSYILDTLQASLPKPENILLITIPDFGVTPQGPNYGRGRHISEGIAGFNAIIKQQAGGRHLPLVDIFELSKKMGVDRKLVADDGLHPSALEYAVWEKLIRVESLKLLKAKN